MKTSPASDESMSSRASRLRSMDDEKCSVILRPIHHVDNMCLCYDDPADCTTCTLRMEYSDTSRNMFYLDESEGDFRLTGGSSADVSSSDGSSLFDEDFIKNVEENINCHLEERVRLVKKERRTEPEISKISSVFKDLEELPIILERKIRELQESFHSNSFTLGQMMTMHGYQTGVLADEVSRMVARVNAEKLKNLERQENVEDIFNKWEVTILLLAKCRRMLQRAEKDHEKNLKDLELVQSGMEKIREIRKNMGKLDEFDKNCEFWTEEQREILDDVSTCQSFYADDL